MGNLRVAAYCRVGTNYEEQESSLEMQISYYRKLIAECEGWQLVKIYVERASGTQIKKRPEFVKMIKAYRQGKIDLILTKSMSRFGRNILDDIIEYESDVSFLNRIGLSTLIPREIEVATNNYRRKLPENCHITVKNRLSS